MLSYVGGGVVCTEEDIPHRTKFMNDIIKAWKQEREKFSDEMKVRFCTHASGLCTLSVRVVRPAYYLEFQRISGRGCERNLLIKGGAEVLEEINEGSCIATVALISYIEESVFYLLREMTRNCIIENVTVQRSCSRRSVAVTNGVFSVDKGKDREGDRAERKRFSFNTPLEIVISC